jgi:hypothetical protein
MDAITVYVVFAYDADLAPDEAAKGAIAALDNIQHMGHTLRADTIGGGIGDPKRTVFVGSLDFASREEDVRVFFEGLVSAERGPRSAVTGDDSDSENEEDTDDPNAHRTEPKTWVSRVRIIRDKDTQLGKGFAYVQFAVRVIFIFRHPEILTRFMIPALNRTVIASTRYSLSNQASSNSPNASCALSAVKPYPAHSTHHLEIPAPHRQLPHEAYDTRPRNPLAHPRLCLKVIQIWARSWSTCPRLIARPPKRSTLHALLDGSQRKRRVILCRYRSRRRTGYVYEKTRRNARAPALPLFRKKNGYVASRT